MFNQNNAMESTVRYIEKKMFNVFSFDSKFSLLDHAVNQAQLPGLFCEFGVFTGETINHIANKISTVIHGFDSFEGLPEFWRDGFDKGTFSIKDENGIPSVRKNVKLHVGWFDNTLPIFINNYPEALSFIHVDCDLYSSTKTIFNFLESRIHSGTIIVFDEYFNYPGWEQHEYKAFQEFIAENNMTYQYIGYNKYHEQVAVRIL